MATKTKTRAAIGIRNTVIAMVAIGILTSIIGVSYSMGSFCSKFSKNSGGSYSSCMQDLRKAIVDMLKY